MADRYWVGGTGSWSDTSFWSATAYGVGGASVPGLGDYVYIINRTSPPVINVDQDVNVYLINMDSRVNTITFNTNNYKIEATRIYIAYLSIFNAGSSEITLHDDTTDYYGNKFVIDQNAVFNAGTSTIIFTSGGGIAVANMTSPTITFYDIHVVGSSGDTGYFYIDNPYGGPGTFNIHNLTLDAGTTSKFAGIVNYTLSGTFYAVGTLGNLITMDSNDSNTYTINAEIATIAYVDVKSCIAGGTAIPFDDTLGGVDSGGNTNWIFTSGTPVLTVAKSVSPDTAKSNGGSVTYTYTINNTGDGTAVLSGLTDDVYGVLTGVVGCNVGATILPGSACSFTLSKVVGGSYPGSIVNTFTATGNGGLSDTASATVTLTEAVFPPVGFSGSGNSKMSDPHLKSVTNPSPKLQSVMTSKSEDKVIMSKAPKMKSVIIDKTKIGGVQSRAPKFG